MSRAAVDVAAVVAGVVAGPRRGRRGRGEAGETVAGRGLGGRALAPARPRAARPPAEESTRTSMSRPVARAATKPFGSVWDSQLGTPSASTASRAPIIDEEDFEEPEIPEYLIAEQRRGGNRGGAGGGRGARGGRSAYQSAMERERYGRGRRRRRHQPLSRRECRTRPEPPPREERGRGRSDRPAPAPVARNSSEPWSDVPPELEAMLRAQVAQKPAPGRSGRHRPGEVEPIVGPRCARRRAVESGSAGAKDPSPAQAGGASERRPRPRPRTEGTSPAQDVDRQGDGTDLAELTASAATAGRCRGTGAEGDQAAGAAQAGGRKSDAEPEGPAMATHPGRGAEASDDPQVAAPAENA